MHHAQQRRIPKTATPAIGRAITMALTFDDDPLPSAKELIGRDQFCKKCIDCEYFTFWLQLFHYRKERFHISQCSYQTSTATL